MSKGKAKLVNEYVKTLRAGIPFEATARAYSPNSIPDNVVVVGRVRTEDGSWEITRSQEPHPKIGNSLAGTLLFVKAMV